MPITHLMMGRGWQEQRERKVFLGSLAEGLQPSGPSQFSSGSAKCPVPTHTHLMGLGGEMPPPPRGPVSLSHINLGTPQWTATPFRPRTI